MSIVGSSLFIYQHGSVTLYLIVYVANIYVIGPSLSSLNHFITTLSNRLSLKYLDTLSYFLGFEVTLTPTGLFLNQTKYINDILAKYHMLEAKHVSTPMSIDPPLKATDDSPLSNNATDYCTILGSLQRLYFTRPDVAYSVNKLSQYVQRPMDTHWIPLK